nr:MULTISPECIES: Mammalian cell entry related domain protein [unclassified Mycolicibacterium]
MTIVGAVAVSCSAVVATLVATNPFADRAKDRLSVEFDTTYVVQGIIPGTAVVMHGVEVGKVTDVASLPSGGVRLATDLYKRQVQGLTDAVQIDFRPANYFGISGINLTAVDGGQPLRDGTRITTVPLGNFTLQAMLTRLGDLSTGVFTPQLIDVIDRATRYTDALNPLVETMLTMANTLAQVQKVPTEQLLKNTTGLSVVSPAVLTAVTNAGDAITHADKNWMHKGLGDNTAEEWESWAKPSAEAIVNGIFTSVGTLEKTHVADLLPMVNGLIPITDAVPPLLRPEGVAQTLVELRTRFEHLYSGTPEQRALQVRIVLDSLPGVAAPLGVMGAPQ